MYTNKFKPSTSWLVSVLIVLIFDTPSRFKISDDIEDILEKAGVSSTLRSNLLDGIFTPTNYSTARFETKVNLIDEQLRKDNKESIKFKFKLNEDYVFPIDELDDVKDSYEDKKFFERGNEYDPGKYDYKLDKKGNMILDENGDPIRDEGFIKRGLRSISPLIKKGVDKLLNPLSNALRVETPPLPKTGQPKVQLASVKDPNTNLTRTQQALLSPTEQVIASRRTT